MEEYCCQMITAYLSDGLIRKKGYFYQLMYNKGEILESAVTIYHCPFCGTKLKGEE